MDGLKTYFTLCSSRALPFLCFTSLVEIECIDSFGGLLSTYLVYNVVNNSKLPCKNFYRNFKNNYLLIIRRFLKCYFVSLTYPNTLSDVGNFFDFKNLEVTTLVVLKNAIEIQSLHDKLLIYAFNVMGCIFIKNTSLEYQNFNHKTVT